MVGKAAHHVDLLFQHMSMLHTNVLEHVLSSLEKFFAQGVPPPAMFQNFDHAPCHTLPEGAVSIKSESCNQRADGCSQQQHVGLHTAAAALCLYHIGSCELKRVMPALTVSEAGCCSCWILAAKPAWAFILTACSGFAYLLVAILLLTVYSAKLSAGF